MSLYTNSPSETIPQELLAGYSMNGTVPILPFFINGTNDLDQQQWSVTKSLNVYNSETTIELCL